MKPKSKLKKWERISTRVISKNPYMRIEEDKVRVPSGKVFSYYISNRGRRAVSVIARGATGRILIQKEYRYPVHAVVYEFPGGMADEHESMLHAAQREFREETGFKARTWIKLGTYLATPSRTDLDFAVYLAEDLAEGTSDPDEFEYVEHEWISEAKLRELAQSGTITSQTMIATTYLYFEYKRKKHGRRKY